MATRRERIVLELEDNASGKMLAFAAATRLADDAVGDLGGSSRSTARENEKLSTSTRKTSKDFDDLERRARGAERGTSALVDSIVALAPALVPIGAVAVPGLAGLTAQLGFAAAAGGTMLLAFNGLGDALKAYDKYKNDPTPQNFAAMREEMEKMGPAGQDFVRELSALEPKLKSLRATAQAGLFPGMTAGIDGLLTRMPQIKRLIAEVSDATGDLFAKAGQDVAGGGFDEFFEYLQANARPILTDMGATVGNLTHTFANLMVATAPLQGSFSAGLRNVTQDLQNWSEGLSKTQGFSDFLDYLSANGPRVGHAVAAISNAIVQVVEAAAPLGGPTLNALTAFANVVSRLADSPLGTPLVGLASGLALVNRVLATRDIARTSSLAQMLGGRTEFIERSRGSIRGLRSDLAAVNSVGFFAGTKALATPAELERSSAAAGRLGASLRSAGKGAAVVAGLGIATSGMADKMGMANTASYALMGTIGGPWGAAIGAGIGSVVDLKGQLGELSGVTKSADRAFDNQTRTASSLRAEQLKVGMALSKNSIWYRQGINVIGEITGANAKARASYVSLGLAADDYQSRMTGKTGGIGGLLTQGLNPSGVNSVGSAFDRAADAAGMFSDSLKEVNAALTGRTTFGAYKASVLDAAQALKENGRSLDYNTRAGIANNSALDNLANTAISAAQNMKPLQQARFLGNARQDFVQAAIGFGKTRDQARALATEMGLVNRTKVNPKINVQVQQAQQQLGNFVRGLNLTPKQKRTLMQVLTTGSAQDIKRHLARLNLTPAQKKTLMIAATAAAKGDIAGLIRAIGGVPRTHATRFSTTADLSGARAVQAALNQLHDRTVYVSTIHRGDANSARGNLFDAGSPFVRHFARGSDPDDLRNNHQPKLYPPGPARVFREEETDGEGYIPMRNDSRRPRAKGIAETIVNRFGGTVEWNALGSLTPGKDYADYKVAVLQAQADISQAQRDLNHKVKVGQRKVQVRNPKTHRMNTVLTGGHMAYELQGGARALKRAELAAAKLNLQEIKAQYAYDAATPARQAALDAAKNRAQATQDAAKVLAESSSDLSGKSGIFGRGFSATGAVGSVNKQIADISAYGQVVAQLRSAGASPALLAQVVQKAESGDLTSAIRMGKALLAQPDAIKTVNSSLAELQRVSTSVATYTNSAGFASGQGTLAAPAVGKTVNVTISPTADPTRVVALLRSTVKHEVGVALASQTGG